MDKITETARSLVPEWMSPEHDARYKDALRILRTLHGEYRRGLLDGAEIAHRKGQGYVNQSLAQCCFDISKEITQKASQNELLTRQS